MKSYIIGLGLALTVSLIPIQQPTTELNNIEPIDIKYQKLVLSVPNERKLARRKTIKPKAKNATGVKIDRNVWEKIGLCESTNNYKAVNPAGYYGRWQFDQTTWDSNAIAAGLGHLAGVRPDKASPEDQDRVRDELFSRRGYQPWECAFKLGIK